MGFYLQKQKNQQEPLIKICFNNQCFLAEVVKTPAQRAKGLMFRESLEKDKAMLFVFEELGVHSFWMKNCKIPLDIIWLDENYKVIAIMPNNQPCLVLGDCPSINPGVLAKYVLEINAGLAEKTGLSLNSYFRPPNP